MTARTKAPAANRAAGPGAANPSALPPEEVCARLWAVCGSSPDAEYARPWDGIAASLRERLAAAVDGAGGSRAASRAARLADFASVEAALRREAPAVRQVLFEIHGLVATAGPGTTKTAPALGATKAAPVLTPVATVPVAVVPAAPAAAPKLLGSPLEYETLVY